MDGESREGYTKRDGERGSERERAEIGREAERDRWRTLKEEGSSMYRKIEAR